MEAIIFDFDGLIFDTETIQYELLNEFFVKYGTELPLSRWQQEIGTHTGFLPFEHLAEKSDRKINPRELELIFKETFNKRLLKEPARPGVESYLQEAKELGLKIGLASSSNYQWVSRYLKHLQLIDYFDCIKTRDDVEMVKPDPSLYLQSATCLGVNADRCLVFEDSANGALAAKKADMKCVAVPNKVTQEMTFTDAVLKMNSMSERGLKELLDGLKLT